MKKTTIISLAVICGMMLAAGSAQERKWPEKNFYETSLHATARGLAYWYAKEQGGLEKLTGVPITKLNCLDCHVQSCDACHAKEVAGVLVYSTEQARSQEACIACHGIGDVKAAKEKNLAVDVHFEQGMKCLDCHSVREVHGDGKAYNSYRDEGVLDVRCEKCHENLSDVPSHKVHGAKLDCNVCHIKELPSCHNCHFETRVKEGTSESLPLKDAFFLVNSRGKVTLATCLTFVWEKKTQVEFSPSFPHTVVKRGRTCEDCHATRILKDIKARTFRLGSYEQGEFRNAAGVVPVIEGLSWKLPFFNRVDGRWVPIPDAAEPVIQYSGYCTPLSPGQFKNLEQPQSSKK
ncbi:MAG: cytochrome c3 family protein [Candidatus Aminicenantes bacterium]|nr:cytochrome c3 family protein [Candidatus Aminicenantes bacterium]